MKAFRKKTIIDSTTKRKTNNIENPGVPYVFHVISQNSILIFKGYTGNVNVISYFFRHADIPISPLICVKLIKVIL